MTVSITSSSSSSSSLMTSFSQQEADEFLQDTQRAIHSPEALASPSISSEEMQIRLAETEFLAAETARKLEEELAAKKIMEQTLAEAQKQLAAIQAAEAAKKAADEQAQIERETKEKADEATYEEIEKPTPDATPPSGVIEYLKALKGGSLPPLEGETLRLGPHTTLHFSASSSGVTSWMPGLASLLRKTSKTVGVIRVCLSPGKYVDMNFNFNAPTLVPSDDFNAFCQELKKADPKIATAITQELTTHFRVLDTGRITTILDESRQAQLRIALANPSPS